MSTHHEEEKLGRIYDAQLTRRLLQYLKPYKWRVFLALGLTIIVTPLQLVGPQLFQEAIDRYITPALGHRMSVVAAFHGILWISLGLMAALVLSFVFQYGQVRIMQSVGQQTMYDLRKEIFEHLQRLPMGFFDRTPVGRLVTRVTTDVDALNDLFAAGVVAMVNDFFFLVAAVAWMLSLNWKLAFAAFAVLPLMFGATWIFRNSVRDANRRIRTAVARINSFLQEHISGMAVIQLFNRERKAREQFAELNREYNTAFKKAILAYAFFFPVIELLSSCAYALIFWFGGLHVLVGAVTIGVVVKFYMYSQRFFTPIQDLSEKFNILQSAMAASERIFKLLDEPLTVQSAASPVALNAPRGEIEFRNVWFAYRGGENPKEEDWVLRDVSFRVAPGQSIAIVGHTGAGKTTVIQLLLRFYDIQRGEILLDGVDIRELDLQNLRRLFGIVLQDPFLFSGTIESNVRLGTASITPAIVEQSLREVGLGPFIDSLPHGMATEVTERGATLSVGQRQLISFARALAHNPQFLILDEATSSVDTQTESLIREALDRLLAGRTALVIAHRLSTIQHADRILVFHKSRLREEGTHQELLARRGIYYRLYQLQYKDQELRLPVSGDVRAGTPLPAND
ncbi:MAG: ABC transporter ATP-binding protein [Candidatus Acidiferrales bacterium]|jgi:ATP-binding cassette subfamily B protein|nr:ABC transporter ATP-binding protein [Candidatus Acidoferrales bacterium]